MKNNNGIPVNVGKIVIISGLVLIGVCLFFSLMYTVQAGERAVLLTWGKPNMAAVSEGLHFKFPIAQKAVIIDVKTTKIEELGDSASRDLQDVQTTIALNYHLSPSQTPKLYQEIGLAFEDRIIRPAIQESIKSISAEFTAEELVTKRSQVRTRIRDQLKERLANYYIIVDDFNIVNFQFSASFDNAIEEKVTAEQLKLKAEMDLERIKIEAEQEIARAKAEAEALRLQKLVVTPDLIRLREIEAQIMAIDKWNGVLPEVTGGALPFIDVTPQTIQA